MSTMPTLPPFNPYTADQTQAHTAYNGCLHLAYVALQLALTYPDGAGERKEDAQLANAACQVASEIRAQWANPGSNQF